MRALFALILCSAVAQPAVHRAMTLALPHAPRADERVTLLVTVGVIPRGARIVVMTPSGTLLGTIAPYGVRAGQEAGTHTIPIPADAISGKRLRVRMSLEIEGKHSAPTKSQVKRVRVQVVPSAAR